ncbi:hypothetical protein [Nostoc sp. UHCC 0870]|uniref:hypothetical protein n=1 Tax=Nostoc sp. UHCC 0870 TaxID=2914041 RepID=UPI001EDDBF6E|nr:hypothetical protein [Nostoc sp. UHCC 0870]UKO97195.1 hypothetical protein L6494_21800 [Nostoc sp. UHCC 0870]
MTSTNTHDFVRILTQVAAAYRGQKNQRPTTEEVVNALLAAETIAKKQRLNYNFESLVGQWRLCFATGTKKARESGGIVLGKGWYVPKLATIYISFKATPEEDLNSGEIGNQVQLGSISLQLTGPAKYLGKKNILAFDFTQMFLSLFGRTIYQQNIRSGKGESEDFYNQPIAKLPFFAFFLVNADLIAARGRGGGLALWIREDIS